MWQSQESLTQNSLHIYNCQLCMFSHFSHIRLFVTLWSVAYQASLSMGFPGQKYWGGLPYPPPGVLPNPGIEPTSFLFLLHWEAGSLPLVPPGKPSCSVILANGT